MSDSSRLEEILVEQTDRDLTYDETKEVHQLLRAHPEWSEDDVELAAAATFVAIAVSKNERIAPMPAALREKISQQAQAHFLLEHTEERAAPVPPSRDDTIKTTRPPSSKGADVISIATRTKVFIAIFAAAASIAIAFFAYGYFAASKPAKDAITVAWAPAGDPLGATVSGDVSWSNESQAGFMRFVGLPKNDATKIQYQLWIFDAERDERYPVDGGVFDVNAETGEVIVAINPKIRVTRATMFAVTVERPGGVVVSSRERLVVLAKVI